MQYHFMHYKNIGGMLVRTNGMLHWRCPVCKETGESKVVLVACPKCKLKG